MGEFPRVEVEWVDSSMILPGWNDPIKIEKAMRDIKLTCFTTGYLVFENDVVIVVALSRGEADLNGDGPEIGDGMAIPRSAIKKVTRWPERKR